MPNPNEQLMATWKQVWQQFDPVKPADGFHVPRRSYNPIADVVAEQLLLPLDHQRFILAGGRGSGKSTELRAVGSQLAQHKDVILFDVDAHFAGVVRDEAALQRVRPHELIGILGLAVLRAGKDWLGVVEWKGHDKRFAAALSALQPADPTSSPTLDVPKLVKGMAVTVGSLAGGPPGGAIVAGGLAVLEGLMEGFEWRIGLPDQMARTDQDLPVQALLAATNALLDHVRDFSDRGLVIILDGLDRVQDEQTFQQLIVGSSLLSQLRADLVVTFDLGLVERHRNSLHAWNILDFTYFPVATRDGLTPDERGVTFLSEVVRKRLALINQPGLLTDAQIARLAFDSAGSVRDLLRLVRNVAVQCMIRKLAIADDVAIDKVLDRHRRDQEAGLHVGHYRVLQGLLADAERRLPEDDLVVYLLNRQLILAYPNESTWFLPHTALIKKTLTRAGATS